MSAAVLDIDIAVPQRDVQLRLRPAPGRATAVVGPNGAGKSTLLGAIGGVVGARGSIAVDERELLALPVHRRRVGFLQQRPGLFDHMSVRANVAFGLRATGTARREADARATEILERLDLAHLAERKPRALSGGQAQRVAIARALATDPALMLLDEPFAALDADAASRLRTVLSEALAERTALLVTHDLLDVLALADDVAVLESGRLAAIGPRAQILSRPPTAFAAHLVGKSLVAGRLEGDCVVAGDLRVPGVVEGDLREGAEACALIDPARARLVGPGAAGPLGDGDVQVEVESVGRLGAGVVVRGSGLAVLLGASDALGALPAAGERITVRLDPASTPIYAGGHGHDQRTPS
ncbi:ABC transporter ATP-binding protein [Brachybacterium nesterenkovii]|uniref:ABC transporter ATP-binding protein n=1 Tax=Brachybacterium nesterenkovii TaxID=47847 RepID=UPI00321AC36A